MAAIVLTCTNCGERVVHKNVVKPCRVCGEDIWAAGMSREEARAMRLRWSHPEAHGVRRGN